MRIEPGRGGGASVLLTLGEGVKKFSEFIKRGVGNGGKWDCKLHKILQWEAEKSDSPFPTFASSPQTKSDHFDELPKSRSDWH